MLILIIFREILERVEGINRNIGRVGEWVLGEICNKHEEKHVK